MFTVSSSVKLAAGLLAMALPATRALGCYSKGTTFTQYYQANGSGQQDLCNLMGDTLTGVYGAGQEEGWCVRERE